MQRIRKNTSVKAFTLIELLVVITIVAIFGAMILGAFGGCHREDGNPIFINTEYENMKANRQQAEEFKRANDLRERELQLQEAQLNQK